MSLVLRLPGPVLTGRDDERGPAWVLDGRITFSRPSGPGLDVRTIEGWVLPGLVDAHCHVGLSRQGAVDAATAQAQAEADRDAGALLIRDAGQPGDTRWIDGRDDLPRIVRAGRHIARPRRYLRNYGHEVDPQDLVATIRQEARRGDGWVKLVGDWIDRERGDLAPCWPLEALRAGIAAAHQEGVRVTAHCFGEECLPNLLEAGLDCIEHATGLTDATRVTVAARGIPIVPTLVNIANFPDIANTGEAKFPRYATHLRALHERRYETVANAYESGIPVFAGTDAGGYLPHGLIAAEVAELVRAGLPPAAAVDAACWAAREWLGRPGLTEGESADLVVYPGDPRRTPWVLEQPVAVVLRGIVHPPSGVTPMTIVHRSVT